MRIINIINMFDVHAHLKRCDDTHTHTRTCAKYVCLCVCVCLSVRGVTDFVSALALVRRCVCVHLAVVG